MLDELEMLLYSPQPDDKYWASAHGEPPVNLNAVTWYASKGLKPKRIGLLVGSTYQTIWTTKELTIAYERGAAYRELYLHHVQDRAFEDSPGLIEHALNRNAGSAEQDYASGQETASEENKPTRGFTISVIPNAT